MIETILAAFEMNEILYELRQHSAGLNCGRWDYIFSFIKKFANKSDFLLPDRSLVTMDKAFLAAYVDLSIKTCHRRRAHAIGGMSAYIAVKDDEANRIALDRVKGEVKAGHDGTWVAHPGLVPLAKEIFARIDGPHQISNLRDDVEVTAGDLLAIPAGEVSEKGVRTNVSVGIQYLKAWLDGKGSVPLYNLIEDAATAEICRAQLWQWVRHSARMEDGRRVTPELFDGIAKQELEKIRTQLGEEKYTEGQFGPALEIFEGLVLAKEFQEFLTIPAYEQLLLLEKKPGERWP